MNSLEAASFFKEKVHLELIEAVEHQDVSEIESIIRRGLSPNFTGKQEMSPLFWAIMKQRKRSWSKLLEMGADPNLITKSKVISDGAYSAMYYAVISEDPHYLSTALQHTGNPSLRERIEGRTLLFAAIDNKRVENIRMLAKHGSDLNFRGLGGVTPLITAALNDDFGIVELLMSLGADASIADDTGNTLAFLLKRHENPERYPNAKRRVVQELQRLKLW
ncbi:MAG: ankyrin repeat domain-containing protein [Prosthecobacter sp.]